MKTTITLLLLFASIQLNAQSISNKLNAITTSFELYTNDTILEVSKQHLVKKPVLITNKASINDNYIINGYGYESWCLEIVSTTPIQKRKRKQDENRSKTNRVLIELLDSKNNVLFHFYVPKNHLREWDNNNEDYPIYYYSIDLYYVPLILLNDVRKFEVTKIFKLDLFFSELNELVHFFILNEDC